ncbi:MAG: hypothetical protein RIS86_2085 [Planctomycetota bacterium]|jgi:uncharacterized membrane protein YfcA
MIWAWFGAVAVGLSLGLLGSGGAILTVPILVYLVGHGEKTAIAESLAIVGAIALFGVLRAAMQRRIDWTSALLLAIPGIAGTWSGARVAQWVPGAVQLLLLAGLMLTASVLMFRKPRVGNAPACAMKPGERAPACGTAIIAAQGVGLGFATGLVGVGGGFLIVPVLVLLRRLPMPTAIGTSLAIISVNSATGLVAYAGGDGLDLDWRIVGMFIALGVAGSLVGNVLAGRIYQDTLRRMFAAFLVVMAGYIAWRQAPRAFPAWFDGQTTSADSSARDA